MRLYGKNPVIERIRANPSSVKKVYLQKGVDLSDVFHEIKKSGLTFDSVEKEEFRKLCGDVHAQGVMAQVVDYEYTPFDELVDLALKDSLVPVFIDGLTDPQNLGAIIRSLACMGGFCIVIPEHDSAEVNETVLRVASGGENYIRVAQIVNTVRGITTVKEKGFFVAGTALDGERVTGVDFSFPMAFVVGSEGKGIRPGILKHLDAKVKLPMAGAGLSYNAAVAASLMAYEITRRKEAR